MSISAASIDALVDELARREIAITQWLLDRFKTLSDEDVAIIAKHSSRFNSQTRERLRGHARSTQVFRCLANGSAGAHDD